MVLEHFIRKVLESIELEQDVKGTGVGYIGEVTSGRMLTYSFRDTLKSSPPNMTLYYPYVVGIEDDEVPVVAFPTGLTSYGINKNNNNINISLDNIVSYINENIKGALEDKVIDVPNGDFNSVIDAFTPSNASGNAIIVQKMISIGDWFNATSPILITDLLNFYSPNINLLLKYDSNRGRFFFVLKDKKVLESTKNDFLKMLFEGANSSHWLKLAKNLWIFADFAKVKFRVPKYFRESPTDKTAPKVTKEVTREEEETRGSSFVSFDELYDEEDIITTRKATESNIPQGTQGVLVSLLDILINAPIYVSNSPLSISSMDEAEHIENYEVIGANNALKAIDNAIRSVGNFSIKDPIPSSYFNLFREGDEFVNKFINAFYNAEFNEVNYYNQTSAGTILVSLQNSDVILQKGNYPKPYKTPLARRALTDLFADEQRGKEFYEQNYKKIMGTVYKKEHPLLTENPHIVKAFYQLWSLLTKNPYYYMRLVAVSYKGDNFVFRFLDQYGLLPSQETINELNMGDTVYGVLYQNYVKSNDIDELYNFCKVIIENLNPSDLVSNKDDQTSVEHLINFLRRMARMEGDFEYVPEDVMKKEIDKLMSIFKDKQKLENIIKENPDYVDDYFEKNLFKGYDIYNYSPSNHKGFWCKVYTLYETYVVNTDENGTPIKDHWSRDTNYDKAYEKIVSTTTKFFKKEEWENFLKHMLIRSVISYVDLKVDIVDSQGNAINYNLFIKRMKEEFKEVINPKNEDSRLFWNLFKFDIAVLFMNRYSTIVTDADLVNESDNTSIFKRFIENRTGLLNALQLLNASWDEANITAVIKGDRKLISKGSSKKT